MDIEQRLLTAHLPSEVTDRAITTLRSSSKCKDCHSTTLFVFGLRPHDLMWGEGAEYSTNILDELLRKNDGRREATPGDMVGFFAPYPFRHISRSPLVHTGLALEAGNDPYVFSRAGYHLDCRIDKASLITSTLILPHMPSGHKEKYKDSLGAFYFSPERIRQD